MVFGSLFKKFQPLLASVTEFGWARAIKARRFKGSEGIEDAPYVYADMYRVSIDTGSKARK